MTTSPNIGCALFDCLGTEILFPVGRRHGQGDHRWLAFNGGTPSCDQRLECRIDEIKDWLARTATDMQLLLPDSGRGVNGFHILVPVHIGTGGVFEQLSNRADQPVAPILQAGPIWHQECLSNCRNPTLEVMMKNYKSSAFKIEITPEVLTDLRLRLKNTRWSYQVENANWDAGTDLHYLRELVAYWQDAYDWRKHETALNQFAQFKTEVDDIGIHFIHERGNGPKPFPIILTHGYPDSFYRFAKIIPMLTDPESFGGRPEDAFDVVVPDLPGYGFSDKPVKAGTIFRVNDLWARLMTDKLGYERFGAHGGDWGSTVTEQLARSHPESVVAIHLTDVPFGHIFQKPGDPSPAEEKFFKNNEQWRIRPVNPYGTQSRTCAGKLAWDSGVEGQQVAGD